MPSQQASAPPVRLGGLDRRGVAASMFALVERGAARRPELARSLRGTVEIRFEEDFAPVRVRFSEEEVLVEDGDDAGEADLVISGSLPDIVHLASAPQMGGIPKLTTRHGWSAIASWAGGRVRIEGSRLMGRRLLKLLQI